MPDQRANERDRPLTVLDFCHHDDREPEQARSAPEPATSVEPVVLPRWSPLAFGRYAAKTLPQVLVADPAWFFWAAWAGAFRDTLDDEARLLTRRARRVSVGDGN